MATPDTLITSPARVAARVPPLVFTVIEWLVLGGILACAWQAWQPWPAVPLADPDTSGYLDPALSWLSGLGFRQTGGRDWLYPAFVALFLKSTGSFAGIVLWQKTLALLSGVLMAVTWRCWVSLFPFPRGILFLLSLAGALPIFLQLVDQQAISYEMSIRPEGVLPFFVYAQLACLMGYAKYRWQTPRALPSLLLGAAAIVLAYACLVLKPSWYLATAATAAPVFLGLFGKLVPFKTRLLTPLLGVAVSLAILWLPGRVLLIRDAASETLLPLALFCVHAPLIDKSFQAKIAALPDSDPERARLQHLDEILRSEAQLSANRKNVYTYLKIDPDYLLESKKLNETIDEYAGHDREKIKAFCFASFRDAVLHNPGDYAAKVSAQFNYFLYPRAKTLFRDSFELPPAYQRSATTMDASQPVTFRPDVAETVRRYREDLGLQVKSSGTLKSEPKLTAFSKRVAQWTLPAELLFLLALAAAFLWSPLHPLRPSGAAALFLFSAPLGNAFGVCLVHALDIYRYRATYGGYWLFALTAMTAWLVVVLVQTLRHTTTKLFLRRS